ncbi:hypothetical protein FE257_011241 [Aspergillus nanangensis]|uniref:EthD domain-containing protein n=1 Tax=Aspergillus nanangensis TaxID=2582783 RepID=A0AAD4GRI9_ASPNN|nr:hypothetical protein FE257_011241 [Aspergillus nanangensis]
MEYQKRFVRFDIFVRRHPSLSVEKFHDYWSNIHAPLIKHWLQRHGVYRYTQYHTPPLMREQYFGGAEGVHTLDFDGHGEVLVEDPDTLKALIEDPYFKDVVEPDEERFIDKASRRRTVGYEEIWVRDGKVV